MKQYKQTGSIEACRLTRQDILELGQLIRQGFDASDPRISLDVSVNLPRVKIESNNIDQFLADRELPDKFDRLSMRIVDVGEGVTARKYISVDLDAAYSNLSVTGLDETWVLGKYSQISTFLKRKRPWFWVWRKAFAWLSGACLVWSFQLLLRFIKGDQIVYATSSALFLATLAFATYLYFKGSFLPKVQVILRPKASVFNKQNVTILIAVVSLIVSVIGGVVIPLIK